MASGKSTVARILESKGAVIVDADQIARRVLMPGRPAFEKVLARFGDQVTRADGTLNRPALARIVFSDPVARSELEAITHPEILSEVTKFVAAVDRSKIVVLEAALLIEARAKVEEAVGLDALIVVASRPEDQANRMREGRNMGSEEANARISAQAPLETKLGAADYVIENYGTLEELQAQVNLLWEQIKARL